MPEFYTAPLSWPEAEAAFIAREIVTAVEFYQLAEELRGYAWTITRIAELQVMSRVKDKIAALIADGGSVRDFLDWADESGVVWTDAYGELVFRNAVQSAYSRARWLDVTDPDFAEEFLWLMYDAVDDSRTRPAHAALDNEAWLKEEFPDELWTPNGHKCRCGIRQLNADLLRRSGANVRSGPDDLPTYVDDDGNTVTARPDEGWRSNQARDYGDILTQQLEELRAQAGS